MTAADYVYEPSQIAAARLLIEMLEEDGEEVSAELRAVAAALPRQFEYRIQSRSAGGGRWYPWQNWNGVVTARPELSALRQQYGGPGVEFRILRRAVGEWEELSDS